jgi:hypothetical protein
MVSLEVKFYITGLIARWLPVRTTESKSVKPADNKVFYIRTHFDIDSVLMDGFV